jgi:hypothetical protein
VQRRLFRWAHYDFVFTGIAYSSTTTFHPGQGLQVDTLLPVHSWLSLLPTGRANSYCTVAFHRYATPPPQIVLYCSITLCKKLPVVENVVGLSSVSNCFSAGHHLTRSSHPRPFVLPLYQLYPTCSLGVSIKTWQCYARRWIDAPLSRPLPVLHTHIVSGGVSGLQFAASAGAFGYTLGHPVV